MVLLSDNPNNPLSEFNHVFLVQQGILQGRHLVVNRLTTNTSVYQGVLFPNVEGKVVIYDKGFETQYDNTEHLQQLKSYIYMHLLSQSVENFERLLNKFIQFIFKTNNLPIKRMSDNSARRKFIEKHCPKIKTQLKTGEHKKLWDLFKRIEGVRHVVVHSNQIIKPDEKYVDIRSSFFKTYFTIKKVDNEKLIIAEIDKSEKLIRFISELGFLFYHFLSEENGFPILYRDEKPLIRKTIKIKLP